MTPLSRRGSQRIGYVRDLMYPISPCKLKLNGRIVTFPSPKQCAEAYKWLYWIFRYPVPGADRPL